LALGIDPPMTHCYKNIVRKTVFWPAYCDENMYRLAGKLPPNMPCYIMFISNPDRAVEMHHQSTAKIAEGRPDVPIGTDTTIVWDYHVVLICKCSGKWTIYDTSTTLDNPSDLKLWLRETFPNISRTTHRQPFFKLVPREFYLHDFTSNRTTLAGKKIDPQYYPPWPIIKNRTDVTSNLEEYTNMDRKRNIKGKVYSYYDLIAFLFSQP
jgi:N-terminal glutamine amidase